MSDDRRESLEGGTGIAWEKWVKLLEPHREENHTQIAEAAYRIILRQGKSGNPAWWAQGAAAWYEQHIGRRLPGQQCDGYFAANASKTLALTPEEMLARWQALMADIPRPRDMAITREPQVSRTEKWIYWRIGLEDRSNVSVNIQGKPGGKASLAINHDRILTQEEAGLWRAFWRELIPRL